MLVCTICGLTRDTQSKMDRHMENHIEGGDDTFSCKKCNVTFKSNDDLKKHNIDSHKSYKPCRNYATNNCQYEDECDFNHTTLQGDEQICYRCGKKFNKKHLLLTHIKNVYGDTPCRKFLENKCSYGSRCVFSHNVTNVQDKSSNTRPALNVQNNPHNYEVSHEIPQQVFQSTPTSGVQVVGQQKKSVMILNMNNMAIQMNQMMVQMSNLMSSMTQSQ